MLETLDLTRSLGRDAYVGTEPGKRQLLAAAAIG